LERERNRKRVRKMGKERKEIRKKNKGSRNKGESNGG
jgi:hypothetical protein